MSWPAGIVESVCELRRCPNGRGSVEMLRRACENLGVVGGSARPARKLLGPFLAHDGSTRVERERRLCAMRQAWGALGKVLGQVQSVQVA